VLALLDGVAIPSAFFLSNSRETDTYEAFFRVRIFILIIIFLFYFYLFYSILFCILILACLLL
jgi:hypothetical protein